MLRLVDWADVVRFCASAFVVYKIVELGPQDAAIWFGRLLHAFAVAAQGHL